MDIINEGPSLNEQHKHLLNLYLTHDDIKEATWSIPENKATGLDCYNSGFYKRPGRLLGMILLRQYTTSLILELSLKRGTSPPSLSFQRPYAQMNLVTSDLSLAAKLFINVSLN